VKQVYESEKPVRAKLRRSRTVTNQQLANQSLLAANQSLYNRHARERCFILATGPSIKSQPLHLLAGENCIGVSNFFVHPDYAAIRPRYQCVAPFHAPITEEAWQTWLADMAIRTLDAEMVFMLPDVERNARKGYFGGRVVHHIQPGAPLSQLESQGVDLTRAVPSPQSVTIMALYAAVYMGFSEIYLLGCDHDWILHLNQSRHFYAESQHALNRDGYNEWFNDGIDSYFKDYVTLWSQYRAVGKAAGMRNARIFNATKGGMLDVFPRVELESLVAQRKVA